MAFPTPDSANGPRNTGFDELMAIMRTVRLRTKRLFDQSAAGPIQGVFVVKEYYNDMLLASKNRLDELVALPGMRDYANAEFPPQSGIDINTEWTNTQLAINSVLTWIETNVPTNTLISFNPGGGLNYQTYSTTQTAGLRVELQKILDAIEEPA